MAQRRSRGLTRPSASSRPMADSSKYSYKPNMKLDFYENKYQSIKAASLAAVAASSETVVAEESVKLNKKSSKVTVIADKSVDQRPLDSRLREEMMKDAKALQEQLQKRGYEVHMTSAGMQGATGGKVGAKDSGDKKGSTVVGRIQLSIRTPEPPQVKEEVKVEPKVEPKVESKVEPKVEEIKVERIRRVELPAPEPIKRVMKTMEIIPTVTKTTRIVVPASSHQVKSSVVSSSKQTVVTTKTFVTTTTKVVKSR